MKDRAPQSPIPYSTNMVTTIRPNALSQSVAAIMKDNHREHCADKVMTDNPFAPVHLTKDGK